MASTTSLAKIAAEITSHDTYTGGYPHEAWRILRREAPVFWCEGPDFPGYWSITKPDDIIRISREPLTFSSTDHHIYDMPATYSSAAPSMISVDPPRHMQLRRLVNKGFTPRQIARLEPHVREIVGGIIDGVEGRRDVFDFVTEVSAKLPLAVICELMGVPREDWHRIFAWTNRTIGADDPEYREEGLTREESAHRASQEQGAYIMGLIAERRRRGTDDLVSVLVDAEVEGERLSDDEIRSACGLLFAGGNETTRNATSGGMLALIEHPEQRQRLLAEPSLVPTAIEEILRWTSPIIHFARLVMHDTEIRGQQIKSGQKVCLWYASANRDEELFDDPYRFDVGRVPNEHLAFGIGEHFCLGASLARLELRVMFEGLLRRLPRLELAGPVERLRSNFVGGIKHMPVRIAS